MTCSASCRSFSCVEKRKSPFRRLKLYEYVRQFCVFISGRKKKISVQEIETKRIVTFIYVTLLSRKKKISVQEIETK